MELLINKKRMNMKKLLLISVLTLCSLNIFAQQKVAVYVTGSKEEGVNEFMGAYLVNAIVNNSKYLAVERTSDFLRELAKEQSYQRTGAVDDTQISKLGKQFGVNLVCVANIAKISDKEFVSARLINVETATVVNSTKPIIFTLETIETTSITLAYDLVQKKDDEQKAFLQAQEQQRQAAERQKQIAFAEELQRKKEQEEQAKKQVGEKFNELGETIVDLVNTIKDSKNSRDMGSIKFINNDKDPFDIYVNNEYKGIIKGHSYLILPVMKGRYVVKVSERSGYIIQQITNFGPFDIQPGQEKVCQWD